MTVQQQEEMALARELLQITHEAEINRFLPFLITPALTGLEAVAPLVMKVAAPLLKKVAVGAIKAIPEISKGVANKLPDVAQVTNDAPGGPGGGGGQGGGKGEVDFGGSGTYGRRLWGASFQQSSPRDIQLAMSLRLMRAMRRASRRAAVAVAVLRVARRGAPLSLDAVRRIVFRSLVSAMRRQAPFLLPTLPVVAISLRSRPADSGSPLPQPRAGRIFSATLAASSRRPAGDSGATLPTPKGRVLGEPRQDTGTRPRVTACRACTARREAGIEVEQEMSFQ
ncbi:hypothetical protein WME79_11665 [Sorangium sp. So ce726]|uniref:hypothetical protein n=1 Tax=Sorangium sp. So ce726 TaxID=3133319 RepID=UPI003F61ED7E